MLRSAIAETISADALCPVTCGDLTVGHTTLAEAPTPLEPALVVRAAGHRPPRVVGRPGSEQGRARSAARSTPPVGLQQLVMEALSTAFESILGEGLGLGAPVELPASDAPLLLLRLPLTSVDNEEVIVVSAYDDAVAGELAAHIVALQALAAEAPSPTPPPAAADRRPAHAGAQGGQRRSPGRAHPAAVPGPATATAAATAMAANVRPAQLPELTASPTNQPGYNIDLLLGVNLQVAVEIGRTTLPIRDVLALTPGSIVELDKLAGEKVDVLINGRPIAQGEVVVVDENFGVRITDVVSRQQRLSPQGR